MKSWFRHPVRVTGRVFWLAAVVIVGLLAYLPLCGFSRTDSMARRRAHWLQFVCRQGLRVFGVELAVTGAVPSRGFMVCNHLGYLDILTISASVPVVFVAKREVRSWPVFGWFGRMAGTLFVRRESRTHVRQVAGEIEAALKQGLLVVLFPEGTSSDGQTVLPFKSSLIEPVARVQCELTAALIEYHLEDGDVGEEVCYWKDMTLVPHLINLMSKKSVQARLHLRPVRNAISDRKELARQLHGEVAAMMTAARSGMETGGSRVEGGSGVLTTPGASP
jgi:1-acyl-sn-glycerol-3-phosphate acyltransferase